MSFVSYAQNFEDVMLWRALKHVEHGCYVDIGAQHPVVDSVSRAFYEKGWRGIHVEPTVFYADAMRQDRPDELVVQAAIGNRRGLVRFFEIPETGLSTAFEQIARHHEANGHPVRETTVTVMMLDDLLDLVQSADVHWLKIDVEGSEREVIASWRKSRLRPWMIVIESTYPTEVHETHRIWEKRLCAKGYTFAYADGVNRYYVSESHKELAHALRFGPNVFDQFQLSETLWSVQQIRAEKANVEEQLGALRESLPRLKGDAAERERSLSERLARVQKDAEQARNQATTRLREVVERERMLTKSLEDARRDAREAAERQAQAHAQREKAEARQRALTTLVQQSAEKAHEVAAMHLRELIGRERALNEKLGEVEREAREAAAYQAQAHAQREQELMAEIAALRQARSDAEREAEERQKVLSGLVQQAAEKAQDEAREHLRDLSETERAFAERLEALHREAREASERQAKTHEEHLHALKGEVTSLLDHLSAAEREAQERDRSLSQQLEREREKATQIERRLEERDRSLSQQLEGERERATRKEREVLELEAQLNLAQAVEVKLRSDLTTQADAAQASQAEIESMQKTMSWRFTAPLRRLHEVAWRGHQSAPGPAERRRPQGLDVGDVQEIRVDKANAESRIRAEHDQESMAMSRSETQMETANQPESSAWTERGEVKHVTNLLEMRDEAFVTAVYQTLLGRAPDPEGMRHYLSRLRSGCGRRKVIADVASSSEAKMFGRRIPGLRLLRIAEKQPLRWFLRALTGNALNERHIHATESSLYRIETRLFEIQQRVASSERIFQEFGRNLDEMDRRLTSSERIFQEFGRNIIRLFGDQSEEMPRPRRRIYNGRDFGQTDITRRLKEAITKIAITKGGR